MVLDTQRHRLDGWLVPMARLFRNVNPNAITWLSFVAALAAGAFFAFGGQDWRFLVAGSGMVFLNGVLDVLDGKVATITGKQSRKGDYLDHAIDRFSDAIFIGGLAFGAFGRIEIGLAALTFTLLTSYLGTQAQAVGIGRNYSGFLGRADRMMLLILVPTVQGILVARNVELPGWWTNWSPSLVDTMLIYFAVMGFFTTVQRFASGLRSFEK
jgi:archaetidylinositol phosphate synthase